MKITNIEEPIMMVFHKAWGHEIISFKTVDEYREAYRRLPASKKSNLIFKTHKVRG